ACIMAATRGQSGDAGCESEILCAAFRIQIRRRPGHARRYSANAQTRSGLGGKPQLSTRWFRLGLESGNPLWPHRAQQFGAQKRGREHYLCLFLAELPLSIELRGVSELL